MTEDGGYGMFELNYVTGQDRRQWVTRSGNITKVVNILAAFSPVSDSTAYDST